MIIVFRRKIKNRKVNHFLNYRSTWLLQRTCRVYLLFVVLKEVASMHSDTVEKDYQIYGHLFVYSPYVVVILR